MDRQPIISAKDVEITFSLRGRKLNAIRKCSLDLYEGETLAIVGESGSGKSVFTKTFVGMLDANGKITGGSIMFEGRDMTKFTEKDWLGVRGKKIAMVMQDPMTSLNPLKKIGKQIQESIEHHQGLKGEEAKKAAIEMLGKVGKESKFVDGLRYTDAETMDIVQQVLCGRVNKNLVATLNRMGARALGLCGLDGGLFQAVKKDLRYGLVGEIRKVDPEPVLGAIDKGYIPVVSTVAMGVDGETSYNINADTAAARLATAIGAEKLILLTDVPGLMRDPKDESTLISVVHMGEVPKLIEEGIIKGGMIPKLECAAEFVRGGDDCRAHILDGRVPHSILIEILTDQGIGTMLL